MLCCHQSQGNVCFEEGNTCCVVINVSEMFVSSKETHVLSSMSGKCLFLGRKHMLCCHQCQGNVCFEEGSTCCVVINVREMFVLFWCFPQLINGALPFKLFDHILAYFNLLI